MEPVWRKLDQVDIPAKPTGLWTKAINYVGPSRSLRFKAAGTWTWKDAGSTTNTPRACGPDGDLEAGTVTGLLSADALPGALIGKIGGSSAAIKNAAVFVVGAEAIVEVDDKTKGALYLSINDAPAGFADNDGKLQVTIWESL